MENEKDLLAFLAKTQGELYNILAEYKIKFGEKHQFTSIRKGITDVCSSIESIKSDIFYDKTEEKKEEGNDKK